MSFLPRDSSTLLDMLLLAHDVREFVSDMTFEVPLVWRVVTTEVPHLIQNLSPLVPAEPPPDSEIL